MQLLLRWRGRHLEQTAETRRVSRFCFFVWLPSEPGLPRENLMPHSKKAAGLKRPAAHEIRGLI
jgi:hypothetical protein